MSKLSGVSRWLRSGWQVTWNWLGTPSPSPTEELGKLEFDSTKPDGTPRKLIDTNKLTTLGWESKIKLKEGISNTIREFEKISCKNL